MGTRCLRSHGVGALVFGFCLFLFASGASAEDRRCWKSNSDYFASSDQKLKVLYNPVSVNTVRAVYIVGKPASVLFGRVDDVFRSAGLGFLRGGPKAAVANVIVNEGTAVGLSLLGKYLKTPQQVSREIANGAMREGLRALNENYAFVKAGLATLGETEKQAFRANQVYVDALGAARVLFSTASEDSRDFGATGEIFTALDEVEKALKTYERTAGGLLVAYEILQILERSKLDLAFYEPMQRYVEALDAAYAENERPGCVVEKDAPRTVERQLDSPLVIALIDTSGSMKDSDPRNLRRAALDLFSGLANASTRLGVIRFSDQAQTLLEPTAMGLFGSAARQRVRDAVSAIGAEGGTSIGDALALAAKTIGADGATVILLSDGKSSKSKWSGDASMLPPGTVVHAIALSEKADRTGLEKISRDTGGVFEIARSSDDLARLFANLFARAQDEQIAMVKEARIGAGDTHGYGFDVEPGNQTVTVSVDWPGSDIDLRLIGPDGVAIDSAEASTTGRGVEADTFDVIRLDHPAPGRWKIEVQAVDVDPKGEPYTLRAGLSGGSLAFNWRLIHGAVGAGETILVKPAIAAPVRWLKSRAMVRDITGQIIFKGRVAFGAKDSFEIPAIDNPGDYLVRLEVEGEIGGKDRFSRVFDRTIAIGPRRETTKTVVVEKSKSVSEPAYVNPNALVLQLAPGHRAAYGLEDVPSVDLDIRFAYDSATLEPASKRQLDALGEALNADALRDATFKIIGHTDAKGATSYNQDLSEKRAEAVRAYLISRFSMDPSSVTATGRGEIDLKDALFPDAASNRRVEVRVVSKAIAKPTSKSTVASPAKSESRGATGSINWGAGGASKSPAGGAKAEGAPKKSGGKVKW